VLDLHPACRRCAALRFDQITAGARERVLAELAGTFGAFRERGAIERFRRELDRRRDRSRLIASILERDAVAEIRRLPPRSQ
jgi:hypothetical protein